MAQNMDGMLTNGIILLLSIMVLFAYQRGKRVAYDEVLPNIEFYRCKTSQYEHQQGVREGVKQGFSMGLEQARAQDAVTLQENRRLYYKAGKKKGRTQGLNKARQDLLSMQNQGYQEGFEQGKQVGFQDGYDQAKSRCDGKIPKANSVYSNSKRKRSSGGFGLGFVAGALFLGLGNAVVQHSGRRTRFGRVLSKLRVPQLLAQVERLFSSLGVLPSYDFY